MLRVGETGRPEHIVADEVPRGGPAEVRLDIDRGATFQEVADHRHLLRPDRIDQRRQADGGRLEVDEGTRIQQQRGDIHDATLRGEMQGRGAHAAVDRVDIGTGRQEFVDHLHRTAPGGEHQRREGERPPPVDIRAAPDSGVRSRQIIALDRRQ